MINGSSIAILIAGICISGAILYTNGTFDFVFEDTPEEYPFQDTLDALVNDPENLMMRNVVEDTTHEGLLDDYKFCGELNPKNLFNAYTGWQKFIAMRDLDTNEWTFNFEEDFTSPFSIDEWWCS